MCKKALFLVFFFLSFTYNLHPFEIDNNPAQTLINFSRDVVIANYNLRMGIFIEKTERSSGVFRAKTFVGNTIYNIVYMDTFESTWTSISDPDKLFFNHIYAAFLFIGGVILNEDNQKMIEVDETARINITYIPDEGVTEIRYHLIIR